MNRESCISILKVVIKDKLEELQNTRARAETCTCNSDHRKTIRLANENLEFIHQAFDYLELNLK